MKIFILTLITIFSVAVVVSAKTPETLTLCVSQSKTASKSKVTVKFLSVVEDSRCPVGTNCIWAGNAKVKLIVSKGKAAAQTIELNSGLDPQTLNVYGYEIKFVSLTPYPGENAEAEAKPATVTLFLTIAKLGAEVPLMSRP